MKDRKLEVGAAYANNLAERTPRPAEDIWAELDWLKKVSDERLEFQHANEGQKQRLREILTIEHPAFVFPKTDKDRDAMRSAALRWELDDDLRRRWNDAVYAFYCGSRDPGNFAIECLIVGFKFPEYRSLWNEHGVFQDSRYFELFGRRP